MKKRIVLLLGLLCLFYFAQAQYGTGLLMQPDSGAKVPLMIEIKHH